MMRTNKNRVLGGLKAAKTLKAIEPNYCRRIGRMGGLTPKTSPSGFAVNRELASQAGTKGGLVSGYKRRARNA